MTPVPGIRLPEPSDLTRPFWDGCREGELRVQECQSCRIRFFTPLPACPKCRGVDWKWVVSPGTGTLYSFSVVHRPALPDRATPYVLAAIDLDDGWTMMSNVVTDAPDTLRCDQKVAVRFVPVSDEITMPMFAPVGSG